VLSPYEEQAWTHRVRQTQEAGPFLRQNGLEPLWWQRMLISFCFSCILSK
jgi:hypothetical protein